MLSVGSNGASSSFVQCGRIDYPVYLRSVTTDPWGRPMPVSVPATLTNVVRVLCVRSNAASLTFASTTADNPWSTRLRYYGRTSTNPVEHQLRGVSYQP